MTGVVNILDADDDGHRRMRRLQNPAFSDKALRSQEAVIRGYASLLTQKLRGICSRSSLASSDKNSDGHQAEAVVDLTAWYNFTTFDVIGDLAFGEPFYCLRDEKWHWWIQAVFDIFKAGTMLRAARRFPEPLATLLLVFCIPQKLLRTRKEQFAFGVERVNKRLAEEEAKAQKAAEDGHEADSSRPDFSEFFSSWAPQPPPSR